MSIGHLYNLFGEGSFQGLELYKFFIFWKLTPLLAVPLENMFTHTVVSLFILLMVPFALQNFSVKYSFICLFFLLFPLPKEIYWQKCYYKRCLRFYCLCFMVSWLTVKSLNPFEFILVYGISWWSSFMFFIYLSNFPHTIYWRDCLYSIVVLTSFIK